MNVMLNLTKSRKVGNDFVDGFSNTDCAIIFSATLKTYFYSESLGLEFAVHRSIQALLCDSRLLRMLKDNDKKDIESKDLTYK